LELTVVFSLGSVGNLTNSPILLAVLNAEAGKRGTGKAVDKNMGGTIVGWGMMEEKQEGVGIHPS